MTNSKQDTYIMIDAQHPYALNLIKIIDKQYHLKPIVLYTSRQQEMYMRSEFPALRTNQVLEHFYLEDRSLQDLCKYLTSRYNLVAIVPHAEKTLQPAADLLEHLPQISWNSPDIIRRFRDKHALKHYLRSHFAHVPLNHSRIVRNVADVYSVPLPTRFVIKPNDGYANRHVDFFNNDSPREQVEEYFNNHALGDCILEDFLEGPEYVVNGQMDESGCARIINVMQYLRTPGNGRANLYHHTIHVPQTDPAFAPIADYTQTLMQATGLRRSPFHAELILTPKGPILIEVGARMGGCGHIHMASDAHGEPFDAMLMAAHHYLSNAAYTGPQLNWDHYNRINIIQVHGKADKTQRVYHLTGLQEVESLTTFRQWSQKPEIGQMVYQTLDLLTAPFSFWVAGYQDVAELMEMAHTAEKKVQINTSWNPYHVAKTYSKQRTQVLWKKLDWLIAKYFKPKPLFKMAP